MPQRKASPAEIERRRVTAAANLEATHERIIDGVQDLISSNGWADYLKFAASFHSYSFNNSLLIYVQNPAATYVAGYQSWLKLGRQVRKGEKGISILAPVTRRQELTPGAETPAARESEKLQGPATFIGVKNASVFDVSQTDPLTPGEELPIIRPSLLQGHVGIQLWYALTEQAMDNGFAVERGDCGGANGYTNFSTKTVRVRQDVSELQAVKTLAHELAHVLLHDPHDAAVDKPDCRGSVEVEAESVAFMVLAANDLDSAEYTFPYIGGWAAQGNDITATVALVRETGNRAIKASREILGKIQPQETMAVADYDRLMEQAKKLNPTIGVAPAVAVIQTAPDTSEVFAATPMIPAQDPEDLYAVNAAAMAYFQDFGRDSLTAQYLLERGIRNVPAEFSVGYAPVGGGLVAYLTDQGFDTPDMIAAGVARISSDDQVRDVFRDRIIVGVRDADGNLAGFVGRAVREGADPKYMNTRATDVFDKSRLLVGLSEGAQRLRDGATPVLVEGPFDVLAVAQYPSDLVPVAAMGTAVTRGHVAVLGRAMGGQPRRLILGLDDDPAGRQAAYIGAGRDPKFGDAVLDKFIMDGWQVRSPKPSAGLDPAEVANLHGDKVITWLNPRNCQPAVYRAVEERVHRAGDLDSLEQRSVMATAIGEYLANYPQSPERDHAIGMTHDLCRVSRPEGAGFLARDATPAGPVGASPAAPALAYKFETARPPGLHR